MNVRQTVDLVKYKIDIFENKIEFTYLRQQTTKTKQ